VSGVGTFADPGMSGQRVVKVGLGEVGKRLGRRGIDRLG
jgi:hypothetical protein